MVHTKIMALRQISGFTLKDTLFININWIQQQSKTCYIIAGSLSFGFICLLCYLFAAEGNDLVGAPIVGSKIRLLGNFRFFLDASPVQKGYNQVCRALKR